MPACPLTNDRAVASKCIDCERAGCEVGEQVEAEALDGYVPAPRHERNKELAAPEARCGSGPVPAGQPVPEPPAAAVTTQDATREDAMPRMCADGCGRRLRSDSKGDRCSFFRAGKKTPAQKAAEELEAKVDAVCDRWHGEMQREHEREHAALNVEPPVKSLRQMVHEAVAKNDSTQWAEQVPEQPCISTPGAVNCINEALDRPAAPAFRAHDDPARQPAQGVWKFAAAEPGQLPDVKLLPSDYLEQCIVEARRRVQVLRQALGEAA